MRVVTARGGRQRIPRPPSWRPGNPAPWAGLHPADRRFGIEDVLATLDRLPEPRDPTGTARSRPAAVLVALFEEAGEARLILTKRPETMPSHRGEIAFPGGKFDPGLDADLEATARREAHEEIGLDPEGLRVVGRLDGIGTVASQFVITPFVGITDGRPRLAPHPHEVADVFDVALSELLDPEAFREERWDTGTDDLAVSFFELPGETVWGATGRILTAFLSALTGPRLVAPVGPDPGSDGLRR